MPPDPPLIAHLRTGVGGTLGAFLGRRVFALRATCDILRRRLDPDLPFAAQIALRDAPVGNDALYSMLAWPGMTIAAARLHQRLYGAGIAAVTDHMNQYAKEGYLLAERYNALWYACSSGSLELVKWVYWEKFRAPRYGKKKGPKPPPLPRDWLIETFESTCAWRHLEIAQWLKVTFASDIDRWWLPREAAPTNAPHHACPRVFFNACAEGNLDIARWLFEVFALHNGSTQSSPFDSRPGALISTGAGSYQAAYAAACAGGHLHVVQFLDKRIALHSRVPALGAACRFGRVNVIRWQTNCMLAAGLLHPFAETRSYTVALRFACTTDRTHMVRWLAKVRHADPKVIIKILANDVLPSACRKGHLRIARWLAAAFRLRREPRYTMVRAEMRKLYAELPEARSSERKWLRRFLRLPVAFCIAKLAPDN